MLWSWNDMLSYDDALRSHTRTSMFKPQWEPHCSLQNRVFIELSKESKELVMETFWKPMKRLIHSCVQREAVKRSVCLPHHVVSHTHCMNRTPSGVWKKKNRLSLGSLFSFTIKSLIIIIIIVENGHFPLYNWEKSHKFLIQTWCLMVSCTLCPKSEILHMCRFKWTLFSTTIDDIGERRISGPLWCSTDESRVCTIYSLQCYIERLESA